MYLRYPLSYRDTAALLAERGVHVDRSTIYRWVRKFVPQISAGIERRRQWVGLSWHVDETGIRLAEDGGIYGGPSTGTDTGSIFA